MAYTKQTWNTGDTITAVKLNHMEDGIMESGDKGNIVLTFSEEGTTEGESTIYPSSVTAQKVINTLTNGGNVVFFENYTGTGAFSNIARIISVTGYSVDSDGYVMFEISENETDDGKPIGLNALSMESIVEKSIYNNGA